MGFYIPSFIQKRILRYALSKFDVLDTDALGLDSLDIAWGKRSTLELRDVALRQDRLAALLRLPDVVAIQDARIRLLRLTIPADIHASGIVFEAQGVHLSLSISAQELGQPTSRPPRRTASRKTGQQADLSAGGASAEGSSQADNNDKASRSAGGRSENSTSEGLPTAADLAQSFVDTESAEEKAQLKAAVAKSRNLDESSLSESLDVDVDEGYGAPLSLPGFVADFLQGVQARVEVRVEDVQVDVCLKLDLSSFGSQIPPQADLEDVRIRLSLDRFELHPLKTGNHPEAAALEASQTIESDTAIYGKRLVHIGGVRAIFLSDSSVLSFLAQFSGPPSPMATHVSSFKTVSRVSSETESFAPTTSPRDSRAIDPVASARLEEDTPSGSPITFETPKDASELEGETESVHDPLGRSLRSDIESDSDGHSSSRFSAPYHEADLEQSRSSRGAAHESLQDTLDDELLKSQSENQRPSSERTSGETSPDSDLFHSMPSAEKQRSDSSQEDLTKSRIFSHEEASSMYQSAISQGMPDILRDSRADARIIEEPLATPIANRMETGDQGGESASDRYELAGDSPDESLKASHTTDRAVSPTQPTEQPHELLSEPQNIGDSQPLANLPPGGNGDLHKSQNFISKVFFTVATIDIDLEEINPSQISEEVPSSIQHPITARQQHVPGGFSASTIYLADSVTDDPRASTVRAAPGPSAQNLPPPPSTLVKLGPSRVMFDMTFIKIATLISQRFPSQPAEPTAPEVVSESRSIPSLQIVLDRLDLQFVSELKGHLHPIEASRVAFDQQDYDVLLEAIVKRSLYSQSGSTSAAHRRICIGSFTFGYQTEPILAFDSSLKLRESVRDALNPTGHDITVDITSDTRSATDVTIMTLPVHVKLNLTRLDETFNWLGGLSGILELGSSVISNATVTESNSPNPRRSKPSKRVRNVRFAGSEVTGKISERQVENAPMKVTARIGGLAFDLIGSQSSITVDGTAIKVARRGDAIRFTIDRVKVKGPVVPEPESDTAVVLELGLLKFVYLQSPQEDDLDQLLALLAPSRDYNESADDIILDTFLRQRRQGSILRVSVQTCHGHIKRISDFEHFSVLSTDLKKLAPVAKYIPDDDRPGLLTLARIESTSIEIETDHALGLIEVLVKDAEIGHVSLPSILLLGIGSLVTHQDSKELVGSVVAKEKRQNDPSDNPHPLMIHVRLIGDELDPTLKIKLYNLRLEYHISTVMALLGLSDTASGEVVVTELVNSIATLTLDHPSDATPAPIPSSKPDSARPMKLEVSFRDSAIGLNPRGSPARGLVHLTNVSFLGSLPDQPSGNMDGAMTINKMSLLLIDDGRNVVQPTDINFQGEGRDGQHLAQLKNMGYVSVSEISTASIAVNMRAADSKGQSSVEVTIRDDLIVIETCADSTQTLIAIMNGLQPPMPPKKELKYRTEVVPVQDMLASLSGDGFAVNGDEDEDDVDYSTTLDEPYEMDDEVPADLEYDSQFYVPNSEDSPEADDDFGLPASASRPTTSERKPGSQDQHQIADDDQLHINEDHFAAKGTEGANTRRWNSNKNAFELVATTEQVVYPFKLSMKDVHLIWNLFDGYDWPKTREAISQAVAEVETKAADLQARRKRKSMGEEEEDEPVIEDFLFNSIYIGVGVGANHNPRELSRNINRNIDDLVSEAESYSTSSRRSISTSPNRYGMPRVRKPRLRLQRSRHHKMTFELKGLNVDVLTMPPGSGETQSSIDVRVLDLDIFDHVPSSTWKKFATYMHDAGERESGTSMVHLEILNVKPIPDLAASEIILKATVLPLRLHVDQDALDFITRFFEFKDDTQAPATAPSEPPFIQRAEVNSIPVKLDFKPKRVDYAGLRSGRTTEFMNFMILDAADMVLRHVIIYGVSGFDRLGKTLNDIWMPDVKRNQLPGVLAGLAPVRPLVNVGAGVRDLVVIPMREYKKDGRVMRSIQKGALAFAKTTTAELAKLGAKVAMGTHNALQGAEDALAPRSPTSVSSPGTPTQLLEDADERPTISPYAEMPIGVVHGLRGAYRQLERDLLLARDAIVAMPGEVMESGSAAGAARAVARGAPTVVLRPALGVTKAVGHTLMGAATTLDRGERRRLEEKYKRH